MLFLFLTEEFVSLKSIKAQFWKYIFMGFVCLFLKKKPARKSELLVQNKINFTEKDKNGKHTEEETLV